MMIRKIVLVIAVMLMGITVTYGQSGTISGKIVDANTQEAVAYATVAVIEQSSTTPTIGTISDETGKFKIEMVASGEYSVVISYLGYRSEEIENISITGNSNMNLGKVSLSVESVALSEVTVTGAASTTVSKIDRQSFRTADFETAKGGTAVDLLNKLPSISVDGDGEVSLRGTSDIMVYINGKPTVTSASQVLNQLAGDNIESIDIITIPTSKYDAQGKGGIINIVTKRSSEGGLSLLVSAMGGGTPWSNSNDTYSNDKINNDRASTGFNLVYNKGRLSLNGSLHYNTRHNKGIGDINAFIYQDETQAQAGNYYILDGIGERPKWYSNIMATIGGSYDLSENSTLSLSYQYSKRESGRAAHYQYDTYFTPTPDGEPIEGTVERLYNPNDINRTGSFSNLNLDYQLKLSDRSDLNTSFTYESSDLDQTIDNREYSYDSERYYGNDTPLFHSLQNDKTPLDAYRFTINYNRELNSGATIETGAQVQMVRLDGSFSYDTINTNTGNFAGYDYYNNSIDLNRDLYSIYFDYSGKKGNLSYLLGIRLEYLDQLMTVDNTEYFGDVYNFFGTGRDLDETDFAQSTFDPFPTLHLQYDFNDENSLKLGGSRRINRPPAKDMAPFLYRRHQEIFEMGDPLLEPEYIITSELSYTHRFGKNSLIATGFYRATNNAIYRVNRISYMDNAGGVLLRSYTNSGNQQAFGGELGLNLVPAKSLRLYLGGSLYNFQVEADENLFGDSKDSESLNWNLKTNVSWQMIQPLKLTLDYAITSGSVTTQGENDEFQMLNAALNYIPQQHNRWNFSLKMLDILGTNQAGGFTTAYEGERQEFNRDWVYDYEGQILELGVSYTINMKGKKSKSKGNIGDDYF